MALRYQLRRQLHFLANTFDTGEVVITLQLWASTSSRTQVYVRCHNGIENVRKVCTTDADRTIAAGTLDRAERDFADTMMSATAAADEVARRGGPQPTFCHAGDCGVLIPYAAAQCADGHPATRTSPGTYVFGDNRRAPFTVITGGRK